MASTIGYDASGDKFIDLSGLHSDLLIKILICLCPRDIVSMSLCCKKLYEVCNIDILWKYVLHCRYNFDISPAHLIIKRILIGREDCRIRNLSYGPYRYYVQHHFYHLYPLIGLWLFNLIPYNIVMKISHIDTIPYLLQGCVYYLGAHETISSHQVPSLNIATFRVQQGDECKCSTKFNFTISTDENYYDQFKHCHDFELRYQQPQPHNVVCCLNQFGFLQITDQDPHGIYRYRLLNSRVASKRHIRVSKILMQQSPLPRSSILLPGLYKGTFSSPSLQLMLVYYQSGWLNCKKLTGDVYIPGGKIILKVRPRNILDTTDSVPLDLSLGNSYSFDVDIPVKRFIACYRGEAQVAQRGYLYPSFCKGKMYVADTETFVFVTEGDYYNVSYFRRCNDLSKFL